MYESAKAKGTSYTSRDTAVEAFKTKNADKYTTKFTKEPKTRPDYIPTSTTVGDKTYNVTYNTSYGGYGYMGSGGWVRYDPFLDAVILSSLMSRNHYYYDPPVVVHGNGGTVVVHDGPSGGSVLIALAVIVIVVMVIGGAFIAVQTR